MMSNVTYKKLGEVADTFRGLTYAKGDEVPYSSKGVLRSNNIDLETRALNFDEIKYLREDFEIPENRKIKKNSIFICMSNGSMQHLGKVAFVEKEYDYAFGGFMGLIVPHTSINPKYVYYCLTASNFLHQVLRSGHGANINNLKFSDIENYSIPVPSMEIQQRVVLQLDAIHAIRSEKKEQLRELDKLAEAIFYDMFGDPIANPNGWEMKKLCEVVHPKCPISYGIVQPGDGEIDGIPVVRPIDLRDGEYVRRSGLKCTTAEISNAYRRTILRGDELLICVRGTTGLLGFATPELKGCNVTRGIVPLFFEEEVASKFFMSSVLRTKGIQQIIAEKTYGATLKQINIKDLREIRIPLPPLSLQQAFASKISAIEQQKERIRLSLRETEALLAARMQYYFD